MILNQTGADSKNGDNSKNCQDLAGDIAKKHINVSEWAIANCAIPEEANKVLDRVLDYLAANITAQDRQYASSCQERLSQLQSAVNAELEKAQNALSQVAQSEDESLFDDLFDDFWQDITNGLVTLLTELREQRDSQDNDFKEQVDVVFQVCRENTGIPTIDQIEKRSKTVNGYARAYSEYLDEIRTYLSKQFLGIDIGLKRSIEHVKSLVTEVLVEQGHLGGLAEARGSDFIKKKAEQL